MEGLEQKDDGVHTYSRKSWMSNKMLVARARIAASAPTTLA
jgi:hypothetical protein